MYTDDIESIIIIIQGNINPLISIIMQFYYQHIFYRLSACVYVTHAGWEDGPVRVRIDPLAQLYTLYISSERHAMVSCIYFFLDLYIFHSKSPKSLAASTAIKAFGNCILTKYI